jgi:probable HAF family extracellular repeat protein
MLARRTSRATGVGATAALLIAGSVAGAPGASAAPVGSAASAARYTITDLGTLGAGDLSVATAVNNAGQVVGYFNPTTSTSHAFRWTSGVLSDLGTIAGGSYSVATAINDAGQVAGQSDRTPGGYGYPVKWSATGAITDLGGPVTNALGSGNGIDPSGQVVGGQRPADSEGAPVGTLYRVDGTRVDLGPDLGAANGINAVGQVVGDPAYVWRNGSATNLPGFPDSGEATATAINISGQVVGSADSGSSQLAVRWQNNTPVSLGPIDDIARSQAKAINAAGQIVGTADPQCTPCAAPRAWLWQAGTITALDDLIPAGSGWTLQQANGINDRGQIVGAGLHNGHMRAFLLTPAFSATVNFEPAGAPVPTGYQADTGAAYGTRGGGLTYGWNVDNSANTRDRNAAASPDQRYDTFNHLQKAGGATRWELAVPNGRYLVHVVAGDPSALDSTFGLTVEGQAAVSGTPSAGQHWFEGTLAVTVADGRLTITNSSTAANDKINYVDVVSA